MSDDDSNWARKYMQTREILILICVCTCKRELAHVYKTHSISLPNILSASIITLKFNKTPLNKVR